MIAKTEYIFHDNELREKLLPVLKDKIFHVTSYSRFEKIEEAGFIKSNVNGELGYTYPQSENSYGRKKGYICLFDLRRKTEEEIQHGLDCFYFLGIRQLSNKQVHLILKDEYYAKLIYTEQAKAEIGFTEMWIPYVECWYPEDLPLSNIKGMIIVNIQRDPKTEAVLKAMEAIAESHEKKV